MELNYTVIWYFIFLGFNLIGLALGGGFFKKWFDKGFAISKFVGFFFTAIPLWFLASLHILPYNQYSALGIYIALLLWALFKLKKDNFKFTRTMLKEEIVFLAIFLFWNLVRSTNPRIEGTEKFMNLAFMNAINRSEFFPPADMWFSGGTINYYYIGHYLFAFVSKLSSIPMSFVYNFALNTIISYAFIASFATILQMSARSLKRWSVIIALAGAAWLCFGGTLQYFSRVLEAFFQGQKLEYWFPEATRTIPYAINEFPAYSIVLGDLHGHYLGFPFIVMLVGFLYNMFHQKFDSKIRVKMMLFLSLPVVVLYGINSWDFISANFFILLINFYQFVRCPAPMRSKIITFVILEAALLLPGLLFMMPYFFNFQPAIGGIGIVPLNTIRDFEAWFLMWAMFLIILVVSITTYVLILRIKKLKFRQEIKELIQKNDTAILATLLTIAALCLILGVEVFYIKDLFDKENPPYFRTNTIFKFYFAAWPIWVISCSYFMNALITKIYNTPMVQGFMLLILNGSIFAIMVIMSLSYMFEAIGDFYPFMKFSDGKGFSVEKILNGDTSLKLYGTMDGNNFIKEQFPDDYAMINWFNQNVTGNKLIVEAVGDAYTYYSRISANTGLTTIIGWPTHEWQWRSNISEINTRKDDVYKLYTTTDNLTFAELFMKYKFNYVVVGGKERDMYDVINEEQIDQYCDQIFESGNSRIYECAIKLQ